MAEDKRFRWPEKPRACGPGCPTCNAGLEELHKDIEFPPIAQQLVTFAKEQLDHELRKNLIGRLTNG